mmetsp:Transcript_59381/g.94284  ORF Transcript_59381/g.94284 Transcript_59381/m.94284 type:complete len:267 (+) Transcript_59381:67-867(+)
MGNSQTFGIGATSRKRSAARSSAPSNGLNRGIATNNRRASAAALDMPRLSLPPPRSSPRRHPPPQQSSTQLEANEEEDEAVLPDPPEPHVQQRRHTDIDARRLAGTATPMGRRMRLMTEVPVVKAAQPEDIMALPTHRIMNAKHLGEQTRCGICFEDFEGGDCLKTMPCMHFYHSCCISRWLGTSNTCPVCKTPAGASVTSSARPGSMLQNRPLWPHLDDPEHVYEIAEEIHLTQSAQIRGPMAINCSGQTLPERICLNGRTSVQF